MGEGAHKCNRCSNQLKPGEAIRDRDKAGYVHRGDCPPRRKPRPSIGQTMDERFPDRFGPKA